MNPFEFLVFTGAARRDVPLAPMTTYKFGGPARYLIEAADESDLLRVVDALSAEPLPLLILGRGSNILISESGFDGVVLRLIGDFVGFSIDPDGRVTVGGGTPLPKLARETVRSGRGGLEFYIGIPGSVGGAVKMNAGCHGSDTSEWLMEARTVDLHTGNAVARSATELGFGYRTSEVAATEIVTTAVFRTIPRPAEDGERVIRDITQWRREHQPGGTFNAGSVFKNPPDDSAGRIIDAVGLKGYRAGGASVSDKHANFFVADETATPQDVHDLVWEVRHRVVEATGILLEPEIRFAGEFAPHPDGPRSAEHPNE
jgi:UDP-N-acetylmuramate dehydrogenase